jgi:hypothetical protein
LLPLSTQNNKHCLPCFFGWLLAGIGGFLIWCCFGGCRVDIWFSNELFCDVFTVLDYYKYFEQRFALLQLAFIASSSGGAVFSLSLSGDWDYFTLFDPFIHRYVNITL